jgi:hypothetical protein
MARRRVDPYEAHLGMLGAYPDDTVSSQTPTPTQTPTPGPSQTVVAQQMARAQQAVAALKAANDQKLAAEELSRRQAAAADAARRAQATTVAAGNERARQALAAARAARIEQERQGNIQLEADRLAARAARIEQESQANIRLEADRLAARAAALKVKTEIVDLPEPVVAQTFTITPPPQQQTQQGLPPWNMWSAAAALVAAARQMRTPIQSDVAQDTEPLQAVYDARAAAKFDSMEAMRVAKAAQSAETSRVFDLQAEDAFTRSFNVPVKPMFDPFGFHDAKLAKWARDYEYYYQEKPPTTVDEMLDATARRAELERRKAAQLAAESAWEAQYGLKYPRTADEVARVKKALEDRQWQIQNDVAVARRDQQVQQEYKMAEAAKAERESRLQAVLGQQSYEREQEALKKAAADRQAGIVAEWKRVSQAFETGALQQGVMKTTEPTKWEALFGENIEDINKRNFVKANLDLITDKIDYNAIGYRDKKGRFVRQDGGNYDGEEALRVKSEFAKQYAALYDAQNPKSTLESRAARSPIGSAYRSMFDVPSLTLFGKEVFGGGENALTFAEQQIILDTQKKLAPAFIYNPEKYTTSQGRFTPGGNTDMTLDWMGVMKGPTRDALKKLSRKELIGFIAKGVKGMATSNIPSIINAFTAATDSTRGDYQFDSGSNTYDPVEARRVAYELARTLNAVTAVVPKMTAEVTLGAGVGMLARTLVSEMAAATDIANTKEWIGGSGPTIETAGLSRSATPATPFDQAAFDADYARQIAAMNAQGVRIENELYAASQRRPKASAGTLTLTPTAAPWPMVR